MTQITVLSGVERRRHWSDERKLALVEAAIVPGASVAAIARAADISPSSIYRWRRKLRSKLAQPTGFAAVAVHGTVLLRGLVDLIEAHILAGERIHHDDTTVPVMAAGKTITGRIWASVRDDRPFGGTDPPAVCYYYTRDRTGAHLQRQLARYAGIHPAG